MNTVAQMAVSRVMNSRPRGRRDLRRGPTERAPPSPRAPAGQPPRIGRADEHVEDVEEAFEHRRISPQLYLVRRRRQSLGRLDDLAVPPASSGAPRPGPRRCPPGPRASALSALTLPRRGSRPRRAPPRPWPAGSDHGVNFRASSGPATRPVLIAQMARRRSPRSRAAASPSSTARTCRPRRVLPAWRRSASRPRRHAEVRACRRTAERRVVVPRRRAGAARCAPG
jgi:hypothetical protein